MMQRVLKNKIPEILLIVMMLLLIPGLVFSRALASVGSIGLIILCIIGYRQLQLKTGLLVAVLFIILPVMISGYWSDDKTLWLNSVTVKIPLLTMLLGLSAISITPTAWQRIIFFYLLVITAGCCWSVAQYLSDSYAVQQSYLKAKVMTTPADNDYVRFSWMVVTGVFLGIKYIGMRAGKKDRYAAWAMVLFFIIYLHLLAAKTGLLCLYTGAFIYLFYAAFVEKKWRLAVLILVLVIAAASVAYLSLPTLRNRIQYIRYDLGNYSKGNFIPGYNDAARLLSLKAGYDILQANPVTGVGFGDIHVAVDQWHMAKHPSSFAYERFYPTNEWLMYGAGSGWPGLLIFTAGLAILFYYTTTRDPVSIILSATALIPLFTDDSLEGQYGVILLAFIAFFGQKKLSTPEPLHA